MKILKGIILSAFLLLSFSEVGYAKQAKAVIMVPEGIEDVMLLSAGTVAMLDHLHRQYDYEMQAIQKQYNLQTLKQQSDQISETNILDKQTYALEIDRIRKYYISKIGLRAGNVMPFISPESTAMGEITFTYTATNHSDRIIADVVYIPKIGKMKIPTSSKLVLDFVDKNTLKAGLAPGQTMISNPNDPDRFSFLMGQMSAADLEYIKKNALKEFSVEITDIHFTNSIEYKDQSRVLNIEQAFSDRLNGLKNTQTNHLEKVRLAKAEYENALKLSQTQTKQARQNFIKASGSLKQTAVRYSAKANKRGKAVFKDIDKGNYVIYAKKGNQAVFKEIHVSGSSIKEKAENLGKDPFMP